LILGLPGVGKTTIGQEVAFTLKKPWVDTDYRLEAKVKKTCFEIAVTKGMPYFLKMEKAVLEELFEEAPSVVSLGGGSFRHPDLVKQLGVVVHLTEDPEVAYERVMQRGALPSYLSAEDPKGSFLKLAKERAPAYAEVADFVVPQGPHAKEEIVQLGKQLFRNPF